MIYILRAVILDWETYDAYRSIYLLSEASNTRITENDDDPVVPDDEATIHNGENNDDPISTQSDDYADETEFHEFVPGEQNAAHVGRVHDESSDVLRTSDILKKVLSILEEAYERQAHGDPVRLEQDQAVDIMSRIAQIANLLPEEPLEASTPTAPAKSEWLPHGHTPQNKIDTYTLFHKADATYAIVYWFLQDLLQLRLYVRTTWTDYQDEKVSLTTASLAMNAAIHLAEKINKDLIADFPQLAHHEAIDEWVRASKWTPSGTTLLPDNGIWDPDQVAALSTPPPFLTYAHTYDLLDSYLTVQIDNSVKVEELRSWTFPSDLTSMQKDFFKYKLTPDETAFFDLVSAIHLSHASRQNNKAGYSHDAIFRIIDEIAQTQKIATWMAFAVQLVIDARRVLQDGDAERSVETWKTMSEEMNKSLKQSTNYTPDGVGDREQCYRTLLNPIRLTIEQRTQRDEYRALMLDKWQTDHVPRELHRLRRIHIMHSGLQLAEFRTLIARNGSQLVFEEQQIVTMVAHLYLAARHHGKLSTTTKWEDLDFVVKQHQTKHPLRLSGEKEGGESRLQNYLRDLGCTPLAAVADTPESIIAVLGAALKAKSTKKITIPSSPRTAFGTMVDDVVTNHLERTQPPPSSSSSSSDVAQKKPLPFTPQHTLTLFQSATRAAEPSLSFNLLAFELQCRYLLRRIQNVCLTSTSTESIFGSLAGDAKLPAIVGILLLHLEKPAEYPLGADGGEVWGVLDEYVGQHGGEFVERAREECGGDTSTHPSPAVRQHVGDQSPSPTNPPQTHPPLPEVENRDIDEASSKAANPLASFLKTMYLDALHTPGDPSNPTNPMHLDALHTPEDLLSPDDRENFRGGQSFWQGSWLIEQATDGSLAWNWAGETRDLVSLPKKIEQTRGVGGAASEGEKDKKGKGRA